MNQITREIKKFFTWIARPVAEGDDNIDSKPQDKFEAISCVLEFIQNALDAISEKFKNVIVKIYGTSVNFEEFKKNFLKDNFEEYLKHSQRSAIQTIPQHGQDIQCLVMEDYNTTGLRGDPNVYKSKLPDGSENFIHQFIHEIGGRRKGMNANLGGSEGEGKQTFCLSSDISTFFFFTVRDDGSEYFMGISYFGIFEFGNSEYKPFMHFGNMTESQDHSNSFWALPIHDEKKIRELKKIFGVKRNKEPGVSVVIPFINSEVSLDQIREIVCKSYRVPILREKLKVKIAGGDEINNTTILDFYKKHYCKDEQEQKLTEEYFNFINEIKKNNFDTKDLIINPSRPTSLDIDANLSDEIKNDYNSNKIVKYQLKFSVSKKKIVEGLITNEFVNSECVFNFYLKKFPSFANQQYKFCDTIRGDMPVTNCRKKTTNFFLADIQNQESMLLVKTGEVANHTKVRSNHPKYEVFYKKHVQRPFIIFLNNAFTTLQDLFTQSGDELDESTTLDLCSIISDQQIEDEHQGDDEEENEDIITSEYELPEIPNKLKTYRAHSDKENGKICWIAKGVKYSKKEVDELKEKGNLFLLEANKLLKDKNKKIPTKHIKEINQKIISTKNRIDEYKNFAENNYTFFPIKIRITAALDDGSSRPYNTYCEEDFDFGNKNEFKYSVQGKLKIAKHEKNKIVCEVADENFKFEISGFGKNSEKKVFIHHMYERIN